MDYKADLSQRYWEYQRVRFPAWQEVFERGKAGDGRPPVFLAGEAWRNILGRPGASRAEVERLLRLVPEGEKHKWYRSMNSSQALAQSVLGTLKVYGHLAVLADLQADEGGEVFGGAALRGEALQLEYKVETLGERRATSLDGYIPGDYRVAIECKFTEAEVGRCSRPQLSAGDANYERDHCDGTFTRQRGWQERCSLSERGVRYWDFVPALFEWGNEEDLSPCPLYENYQLVRNVLAAGVKADGSVSSKNGHAVLIYDGRNPAFQEGGKGPRAYRETRAALREASMLRKCSWQRMVGLMREKGVLEWLTEELDEKYGL